MFFDLATSSITPIIFCSISPTADAPAINPETDNSTNLLSSKIFGTSSLTISCATASMIVFLPTPDGPTKMAPVFSISSTLKTSLTSFSMPIVGAYPPTLAQRVISCDIAFKFLVSIAVKALFIWCLGLNFALNLNS